MKLTGDLFVGVPGRDQSEHLDLACSQVVIGSMISYLGGDLRGDSLAAAWTLRMVSRSSLCTWPFNM